MAGLVRGAVLLVLLPVASCRLGYDLRPTQTVFVADQFDSEWGWSPVPTAVPNDFSGLARRQGTAPNSTCGFISGLSTSVLTCYNGLYCGFNSGYDAAGCCPGYELVGSAYTLTSCDFFTTCYDSTAVAANCDSACQSNTQDLKCEQSSQPYCITWSFTDIGYTNLGCYEFSGLTEYLAITYNAPSTSSTSITASTTASTTIIIVTSGSTTLAQTTSPPTSPFTTFTTTSITTTSPALPPVVFTTPSTSSIPSTGTSTFVNTPLPSSTSVTLLSSTIGMSPSSSTATPSIPVPASSSFSSDTSSIVSTTASLSASQSTAIASATISSADSAGVPGAVPTNSVSTGSSVGAVTDTQTAPASNSSGSSSAGSRSSSGSSSDTGAIAGGVVGGVVALTIIAGLLWFFGRRRKKNSAGPSTPEVSQHTSMQYPYSPVSPNTQAPSQYGSPEQTHEFPAAPVIGAYNHPMDHPQSGYHPGQHTQTQNNQAHEISSEGTGSSRPLNPEYSQEPEVVQQGGYRGVEPTGGGYGNPSAGYGAQPGFYGKPYSEMP